VGFRRVITPGDFFMFGGGNKVKVSDSVLQKVKVAAGIIGCSVDEFIERALESEAEKVMASTSNKEPSAAEVEEIANQLKGLGYLE
jgi:hypothetical protein